MSWDLEASGQQVPSDSTPSPSYVRLTSFALGADAPSTQVEELGLESEVIGIPASSPAAQKRLIFANNRLHTLPSSLWQSMRTHPPLPRPLLSYLVSELRKPRFQEPPEGDISVHRFFQERLGKDVAEYLADPFCRGITAGDSRKLSMRSLFPEIWRKTVARGSLVKGMLLEKSLPATRESRGSLSRRVQQDKWIAWSLTQGLQRLPQHLTLTLRQTENVKILTSSCIREIEFRNKKARVVRVTGDTGCEEEMEADVVFSSLPAFALASCLRDVDVQSALRRINFVDVTVACLEFEGRNALPRDAGFGFLTPSFEGTRVLGVTFDSCCFPQHDGGRDITRVTCMMGGEWFGQLFPLHSEHEMLVEAEAAVRSILRVQSPLTRATIRVHRSCIPQYHVCHRDSVSHVRDCISSRCPGFTLIGNSYDGVSVNDVIYQSREAVRAFAIRSDAEEASE